MADEKDIVLGPVTKQPGFYTVSAQYDDETEFVLDPAGYVLIRINKETKEIELGFCDKLNELKFGVTGKKPLDIYMTFFNKLKEPTISRLDHAAYIGRELQKAYTALQLDLEFTQDQPLDFTKV